ncbi:sporulation protein YunB [Desulfoscipio geothermicus]|uniref:Sporulation protein YunB n=1 Tax=Desulfoscipio geothermicus DSM 3669 TaxID=1121426 RepID=A0A1I6E7W1_9FIRM|nr:sporulation protein YunB [Desulfoscipio geothermicus]SFR13809.1 sporulation protein YunB [Desulfoscipio geothermicus DSM 3669]
MFKRRKPHRKVLAVFLLLLLASGLFVFVDRRVRPTLFSIAEVEVTQMAVDAINKTVQKEVSRKNIDYQDFITVHRDYNGRVALMQANTVQINRMAADITLNVQQRLRDLQGKQISIPFGQVLGSYILADMGPYIRVGIHPMGTVSVNVIDRFEQAGINQTRHKVYLDFTTMVRVVVPLYSAEVKIATKVPVAESIIVGDVPEAVINFPGGILGVDGLK